MKYFKMKAKRTSPRYKIQEEEFKRITDNNFPYEQTNSENKVSRYGMCPSCLNPIQLIGLFRVTKNRPYGKHTGKDIRGLPQWGYKKYEYCPYADRNKHKNPNDDEPLLEQDETAIELYNLLKSEFDTVIYIISKELQIQASTAFWKTVLNQFLVNRFYCYPWLTEANLPYIFAYWGMRHKSLRGISVKVDSELYNTLCKYGVSMNNDKWGYAKVTYNFKEPFDLYIGFTNHTQNATNGSELKETILFYINDRAAGNKIIFKKTISFNETYFMNLINSPNHNLHRQQWLLDIANKDMPELEKNG